MVEQLRSAKKHCSTGARKLVRSGAQANFLAQAERCARSAAALSDIIIHLFIVVSSRDVLVASPSSRVGVQPSLYQTLAMTLDRFVHVCRLLSAVGCARSILMDMDTCNYSETMQAKSAPRMRASTTTVKSSATARARAQRTERGRRRTDRMSVLEASRASARTRQTTRDARLET